MPLQHAVAEELAQTLNAHAARAPAAQRAGKRRGAARRRRAAGSAGGIFEGEVRVTADKATNSLVITSSLRDYARCAGHRPARSRRRQVFIEAVIMDLAVQRRNTLGLAFHGGATRRLRAATTR